MPTHEDTYGTWKTKSQSALQLFVNGLALLGLVGGAGLFLGLWFFFIKV